jgi:hypothetical protein
MDRTIKIFLIMTVIAVTLEATGGFTLIPGESNASVIMSVMVISPYSWGGCVNFPFAVNNWLLGEVAGQGGYLTCYSLLLIANC